METFNLILLYVGGAILSVTGWALWFLMSAFSGVRYHDAYGETTALAVLAAVIQTIITGLNFTWGWALSIDVVIGLVWLANGYFWESMSNKNN